MAAAPGRNKLDAAATVQILHAAFDAVDYATDPETFVDRIINISNVEPQFTLDVTSVRAELNRSRDSAVIVMLDAGEKVLSILATVVPSPFDKLVDGIAKVCGCAVRADACRQAATDLANRVLALRGAVIGLAERHATKEDKSVKQIINALFEAFTLINKCVQPPPSKDQSWTDGLLEFGKRAINRFTLDAEEFSKVHKKLSDAVTDMTFVTLTTAPSNADIRQWVAQDAAVLRERLEDVIQREIAKGSEAVTKQMIDVQSAMNKGTAEILKSTDALATQVRVLLQRDELNALRIDEDRVSLSKDASSALGSGGYGIVQKAVLDEGTVVVAKCSKATREQPYGTPAEQLAREREVSKQEAKEIVEEAKILVSHHHPNIIRCFGITIKKGKTYVLLEYCQLNLQEVVAQLMQRQHAANGYSSSSASGAATAIDPFIAAVLLLKTCAALVALHRVGQVHRDVKSQNVMIREDGELFLIDLGSAKTEHQTTTTTTTSGRNMGSAGTTLVYAAPEILRSRMIDESAAGGGGASTKKFRATKKCDVYSFGMLMYFVLSGREPFLNEVEFTLLRKVVEENHRPELPASQDAYPRPLVNLMKDCWSPDPDDRPKMETVQSRLSGYLRDNIDLQKALLLWKETFASIIAQPDVQKQMTAAYGGLDDYDDDTSGAVDGGGGGGGGRYSAAGTLCQAEELLVHIAQRLRDEKFLESAPTHPDIIDYATDTLGIPTANVDTFTSVFRSTAVVVTLSAVCAFFVAALKVLHAELMELATAPPPDGSPEAATLRHFFLRRLTNLAGAPKSALERKRGGKWTSNCVGSCGSLSLAPSWVEFCILFDELFDPVAHAAASGVPPAGDEPTAPSSLSNSDNETLLPNVCKRFREALQREGDGSAGLNLAAVVSLLNSFGFRNTTIHELRRSEIRRGRMLRSNNNGDNGRPHPQPPFAALSLEGFCDVVKVLVEETYVGAPQECLRDGAAARAYLERALHDDELPSPLQPAPPPPPAAQQQRPQPPQPAGVQAPLGEPDKIPFPAFLQIADGLFSVAATAAPVPMAAVDRAGNLNAAPQLPLAEKPVAQALPRAAQPPPPPLAAAAAALPPPKSHKFPSTCIKDFTFYNEGGRCVIKVSGDVVTTLADLDSDVLCLALSPDLALVATALDSASAPCRVWSASDGKVIRTLKGHKDVVTCVVFDGWGHRLASGSADRTIRVYDTATWKSFALPQVHQSDVCALAFNRAASILVAGSDDQTVSVWDLSSKKLSLMLPGHTHWVRAVAISPSDQLVASGSHDQTVRVYRTEDGQLLHTFEGSGRVVGVAFADDEEKQIRAVFEDGSDSLFDL